MDHGSFTLNTGRIVRIDSFSYDRTYAGYLTVQHSQKIIDEVMQRAVDGVKRRYGEDRPIYLVPPKLDLRNPDRPRLPPEMLVVWLASEPMAPASDGSHLLVILFVDGCLTRPPAEVIAENVLTLDWETHAADFCH